MGRWEPLVLHADSRAARINLDRRGQFSNVIHISARRFAYPDSTSSPWPRTGFPRRLHWEGCTLTAQFPLPGDLLHNFHLHWISCSPQCRQYLCLLRRLIACSFSLHSLMRMASLTTSPQTGQKRTGAFARL